jgi:hypothetical protein
VANLTNDMGNLIAGQAKWRSRRDQAPASENWT